MSKSLASLSVRVGANISDFQTKMRQAVNSMKKAGDQMKSIGKSMSTYVTAPIVGAFALATKTFTGFEYEMAKVKAISGASAADFKLLSKNARELGASTSFAASEVATLQLNYSKLGFKPAEILAVTKATISLAKATGEDLGQSATVAASTLRGFGLDANEMQRVVDVMAKSFSSSALDLDKFSTAMAAVAPVAKNAGVTIEDTTAFLSLLVDRGVDASTAGTALRNIFLMLAKSGMSFEEAMTKINTSTNQNATALEMFGTRGATVASILANNRDAANSLADAYRNSAGSAKEMSDIMDNTLQGAFDRLKSAFEGIMLGIGESLKPAIEIVVAKLNAMADVFNSLSSRTKTVTVVILGLAAAIGPLLFTIGIFTKAIAGLGAAFAFLTSPITLVILAIAAIAAAFVYVYGNFQAFKERLSDWNWLSNAVIDVVKLIAKFITMVFQPLLKLLGVDLWKEIDKLDNFKVDVTEPKTAFMGFGETVKKVGKEAMESMGMLNKEVDEVTISTNAATVATVALGNSLGKAKQALMQLTSIGHQGMQLEGTMTITDRARPDMTKFFDFVDERLDAMIGRASHFTFMIGDALAAAMDQSLTSGENFFKVFGKMLLDIVKKLAAAAASAIILSIALSAVTGGAGNALTMLGGAAGGGFKDLFGALFGGMAGIPGMAKGGIVPPGFPNDSYPAFLSSGEEVRPSPIPLGGGGGGNVNIRGNAIARGKDLLFTFQNADRDLIRRRGF